MEDGRLQEEYTQLLSRNESKRKKWAKEFKNTGNRKSLLKKAKDHFYHTLTDSVFMFWYGTEWDFNGITQKPREGNIACGYFVTTTLSQCGLKINRAKLAQQPAATIIKTVCHNGTIRTFSNGNLKGLKTHLLKSEDGLFVIGLDNHVGFIDKRDTSIYMIHSSGLRPFEVTIERWDEARALQKSQLHMIGSVSTNDNLFVKWLGGEKIKMAE